MKFLLSDFFFLLFTLGNMVTIEERRQNETKKLNILSTVSGNPLY